MSDVAAEGNGALLKLAVAREHLRVGDEVSDIALMDLILTAQQLIEDAMEHPIVGAGGWPDAESVPATVIHAIKLIATDLNENRATPLADMVAVRMLIGRYFAVSVG